MKKGYKGDEGALRQRKRIRRLVQKLHGIPMNDDSGSDSRTTPSPASSDREDGTDSEPDTDNVIRSKDHTDEEHAATPTSNTNQETDRYDPTHLQNLDFENFRRMMRDRARKRDQDSMRADTDPEGEGPGPSTPRSPMRGLPAHPTQPRPIQHPPPGTPPTGQPETPLGAAPGDTPRSGFKWTTYQEGLEIARRMMAERQQRKKKC